MTIPQQPPDEEVPTPLDPNDPPPPEGPGLDLPRDAPGQEPDVPGSEAPLRAPGENPDVEMDL